MNSDNMNLPQVAFFQRRPREGFNFSLEAIFEDIRNRLRGEIEARVFISSSYNDGIKTKFLNIWEAYKRQTTGVNHITGEVHFLNLLMKRKNVILTVLDCRFMDRKSGNKLSYNLMKWLYLKLPVKQARYVTTISEASKRDIIRYTDCDPDKIYVVPVAINTSFKPTSRVFNSTQPEILQIGTGDNKNLPRLIEALEGIPCHLTIIGRLSDEQKSLLTERKINYTNKYNVAQEEIVAAYVNCDIVAYVSTFEGFGMPIIEANTVERVVLTSNLSSMPEVAGEAALLVDPYSVEDIRNGINKLISNPDLRERLVSHGRENRERFQPDNIARQYLNLYRKISD